MDLHGDDVVELILHLWEVGLGKMRDETREMEEELKADRAAMVAKEKERLVLMRSEMDQNQMLAVEKEKATDKLVADFLEADCNNNFDAQKAMENEIVALMTTDGGVNGEDIGYLVKILSKNKDERAGTATTEEKKGVDDE